MQTAVTDMLAGLIQEGIADSGDYIDADTGLLMCGKCQSKKQTVVKLMGRTMKPSCLCRCKSEELEKEEQKRKNKELMEGIFRLKSAGLQDRTFFGYTFANCDEAHPCAGYAYRYVGHFAEFQKNGQGLLFWGDVGTGKTFLAGCIANALMEKNIPVLMTSFPKLLNGLGGIYSGEKNEYLKSLNRYQLLIIDDLGVERDTPYVLETVYLVIDERYKSGKPFIITTNLSLEKLQNPADLEHGRIYDRIMERCIPVAFSGKNYRTGKGRTNMESASGILKA
ncbi:AAA family ATPase [bacterium 1xD8-6]|nr:AAA family ATPase [bacterium D16-36]RKI63870.1 AAA family ATPase [bacterium 1xD8-6]